MRPTPVDLPRPLDLSRPGRAAMSRLTLGLALRLTLGLALLLAALALAPGAQARDVDPTATTMDEPLPDLQPIEQLEQSLPNDDPADLYLPRAATDERESFRDALPVVALLQGAFIDKGDYSRVARQVAELGFVVVVPNHYGICNSNNPDGPEPDPKDPAIAQTRVNRAIARWIGLWLRAELLGETPAREALQQGASDSDAVVRVIDIETDPGAAPRKSD